MRKITSCSSDTIYGMDVDAKFSYNSEGDLDISISNGDLTLSDALESKIYISIFTWRRASDDDVVSVGIDRGGWWGDNMESAPEFVPENIGNRLWLLDGKLTDENVSKAAEYIRESLAWMDTDTNIKSWSVETVRVAIDRMDATISVELSGGAARQFTFSNITNRGA